ncbi:helix-turn-helix domain-containing protein [Singulisphaera acidiphila]|uniref:Putative transcription regulator containing HTH domain n=1 Tax=Singulisphaera acidiphila (strain ATCC BAA-1392 / DSM 18658 / VKM B-2454 / MOB10) TaxID=886293 RepID=L0DGI9_SINAD|nr:helix-turn-helix domain-containing protein [Singulisphaera acidiphila]AGA27796.1 putative transcription regulator containing HTH domain [Singulisphaera acidiphila DSM 18658]
MATRTAPLTRYMELVAAFPLRPLRSEAQLDRAIKVVDGLIDQAKRTKDEEDYLDVLGTLIEGYEEVHHPMGEVSGIGMLIHLMEARGVNQAGVSQGASLPLSTVSEILAGKRKLNVKHIKALSRFFKVAPGLFIDQQ